VVKAVVLGENFVVTKGEDIALPLVFGMFGWVVISETGVFSVVI